MEEYLSEKEQWEQVTGWLRENGLWIIAGVAVGAAGLWGWHWYQDHEDSLGAQAGAKYAQVVQAFGGTDRTGGFVAVGELERDFPSSPYVDQAKLIAARVYVEDNSLDKAAAELQAVAEHSKDSELGLIARLRLARVQIAQKKPDAALATLNGLKAGAFEPRMHEILGDAYYAKGDKTNALKEYTSAKVSDIVAQSLDAQSLELKIDDLTAENPHPVAQAKMPPAASTAAK
ncbi:MAG: tetratricopeptide repeat protein [Proteobacteria bacterium]|nr:tetratricopeptide repeat protein [Pseudomonadota bacterium]